MSCNKVLLTLSLLGLAACSNLSIARGDITFFETNFDSGKPAQFTGEGSLIPVAGYSAYGRPGNMFTGSFLMNNSWGQPGSATVLTLNNLPQHTTVSFGFLLAVINSWDGLIERDSFNVEVDGKVLLTANFRNFEGVGQGYVPPQGGLLTPAPFPQLGFGGNADWPESAYDMSLEPLLQSTPHTRDSLTVRFFGDYGGGNVAPFDEYWAIDTLKVSLGGVVPEPSSMLLLAVGVAVTLIGHRVRRRRSSRGARGREIGDPWGFSNESSSASATTDRSSSQRVL